MAKAEEIGKKETQRSICMQQGNLQRFMSSSYHFSHGRFDGGEGGGGEEEIELSLGLSLNGRFGIDPRAKKLCRSSSIPDFINTNARRETNEHSSSSSVFSMASGSLVRTCSLPTETEEEWKKRKELQSLRRLEAKRKRSEKQKNFKVARDKKKGGFGEENGEDDKREACDGIGASIGSQGSGSSGLSELESQQPQETHKSTEARSPSSVQSAVETEQKPAVIPRKLSTKKSENLAGAVAGNQPTEPAAAEKKVKEVVRNILEDMPCVSTIGDGPNGKRIEGFLYRYRKGEEVRIVCVCHGSFLSPAEFVKHAGGLEVEHPLKRIVVSPSFIF